MWRCRWHRWLVGSDLLDHPFTAWVSGGLPSLLEAQAPQLDIAINDVEITGSATGEFHTLFLQKSGCGKYTFMGHVWESGFRFRRSLETLLLIVNSKRPQAAKWPQCLGQGHFAWLGGCCLCCEHHPVYTASNSCQKRQRPEVIPQGSNIDEFVGKKHFGHTYMVRTNELYIRETWNSKATNCRVTVSFKKGVFVPRCV